MIALYKLISSIIEPICPCFADHYPEKEEKVYPYVEIKFPNSVPNNSFSDNNLLEVDIWDDKATDIREIETIVDTISKKLKIPNYIDANMQVSISKNNPFRVTLTDPIIHIQRRQLRYLVKVYYK